MSLTDWSTDLGQRGQRGSADCYEQKSRCYRDKGKTLIAGRVERMGIKHVEQGERETRIGDYFSYFFRTYLKYFVIFSI